MANREGEAQHKAAQTLGDKFVAEQEQHAREIAQASRIPAGTNTPTLNAGKVKAKGSAPWVDGHGDATNTSNVEKK